MIREIITDGNEQEHVLKRKPISMFRAGGVWKQPSMKRGDSLPWYKRKH